MSNQANIYEFNGFRLDTAESRLLLAGQPVPLEPQVFKTLLVLVENGGHLCEKRWLLEQVWGETFVEEGNLARNISVLRRALGERENGNRFIETIPKRGYRFVASVELVGTHLERPLDPNVSTINELKGNASVVRLGPMSTVDVKHVGSTQQLSISIRNHWKGIVLAITALVIMTAGFGFLYSTKRGKPIDSLAVLPFTNVTGDQKTEYLSEGISETLINSLSQLSQLKVIARSSSFKYKSSDVDPQKVANALGVQAVVTGRIVQRGDQLQISVEMVNGRDGTQMWGAQYSRPAADLQKVQEEIARTISEKLRVQLTGVQEQQIAKRATENPEAYQLYLNGVFYHRKGGTNDIKRSLSYYQQAVELDANFALAYVGIAETYIILVQGSVLDPNETLPKVKAAVQKALQLDEMLAEAHAILASIKRNDWDWRGAEVEFKRAIALNPNLSVAHAAYGNFLGRMGRYSEALLENKRAQEIDPARVVDYRVLEGGNLRFARRYDEAIQKLQSVIAMQPNNGGAHTELGYVYAAKGMYKEAIDSYQKSMSIDGENTSDQVFLGFAYAMSGKREEALTVLDRIKSTKLYVSPAELAILYIGIGDKEAAFKELERAYTAHDLQLQYLRVDAHYDPLRPDPRFTDLMRRVRLAED